MTPGDFMCRAGAFMLLWVIAVSLGVSTVTACIPVAIILDDARVMLGEI